MSSEQASLKLFSTALSTAQAYSESNDNVKKALTLILSSYLTSKNILPQAVSAKLTDLENYVSSVDKTAIVASLDGHADSVYTITDAALKAKKENVLLPFLEDKILTLAEEIIAPEEKKSVTPSSSSSRLASLSSKVSTKTQQKITEVIDTQVKPQVAYISAIPKQVEEQINSNVTSASATVKSAAQTVYSEFNTRVIVPTTDVLANSSKDEKEIVKLQLLLKVLGEQAKFAWNDYFLVPATSFLSLPDLKPVTLYNAAIKSSQYEYLVKQYDAVLTLPATVSKVAEEKFTATKVQVSAYVVVAQTYVHGQVAHAYTIVLPYVSQYSKLVLPYLPASAVSALENFTKSA